MMKKLKLSKACGHFAKVSKTISRKIAIRHAAFAIFCKCFGEASSIIFAVTIIENFNPMSNYYTKTRLPVYDFSCDVPAEKEHETPVRSSVHY
jgi:hypothetical protein